MKHNLAALLNDFSVVLVAGVSLVPSIGNVKYKGKWFSKLSLVFACHSYRGQPCPTSRGLLCCVAFLGEM